MNIKRVLFIDDGNIQSIVERLRRNLKNKGFTLSEFIIDLGSQEYKKNTTNGLELDFSKIKRHIVENYFNVYIDLVACDYHYANDPLDGYKMLKWMKNCSNSEKARIRHAVFILYSSEGDKFARKTNTVEEISKLIKVRFDDFLKRENLASDLSKLIIKQKTTFDYSRTIIKELHKYPDFEFKSVYPKFKGKTLNEIAEEIDKDLPNGIRFQEYLSELSIAHLIKLNDI